MLHLTSDAINGDAESVQIPWSQFSEWLHCICVVTFDLELGQALEVKTNLINLLKVICSDYIS